MSMIGQERKLRKIIKQAVSKALEEQIENLKLSLLPYVSDKEMDEIKKIFGSPNRLKSQKFERINI